MTAGARAWRPKPHGAALDRYDIAILGELQHDARLSNAELAARIGLSAAPTWRRVKWLEQQRYITGYRAEIDRRKIGLGVLAFVRVDAERNNAEATRALEDAIRALPEVVACHYISGAGTFELQVMCTDLDAYSRWSMRHAVQAAQREGPAHQLLAGRSQGRRGLAAGASALRVHRLCKFAQTVIDGG